MFPSVRNTRQPAAQPVFTSRLNSTCYVWWACIHTLLSQFKTKSTLWTERLFSTFRNNFRLNPISHFYSLPLGTKLQGVVVTIPLQNGTPLEEHDTSSVVSDNFHVSRHDMFLLELYNTTLCSSRWCYEHRHHVVKFFSVCRISTTDTMPKLLLYWPQLLKWQAPFPPITPTLTMCGNGAVRLTFILQGDIMNTDRMSLSFQTCLGHRHLVQCNDAAVILTLAVVSDRK